MFYFSSFLLVEFYRPSGPDAFLGGARQAVSRTAVVFFFSRLSFMFYFSSFLLVEFYRPSGPDAFRAVHARQFPEQL